MKSIRYSKFTGDDLGISAEDLLKALSDFLLESGFNTQYMPFSEMNQHTLEDLKQAIQQALEQGNGVLAHVNFSQMFEGEGEGQRKRYLGRHIVIATTVDVRRGAQCPGRCRWDSYRRALRPSC